MSRTVGRRLRGVLALVTAGALAATAGAVVTAGPATALGGAAEGTAIVAAPGGNGYAVISKVGGQYNYGGSTFSGSLAGIPLNAPIVDAVAMPNAGHSKWFVGADGGVFAMGTNRFFGSMGGTPLNAPVTAIVASPSGNGYLLVGRDGGTFAFGDFVYPGSLVGTPLNAPIVDAEVTADGRGVWLLGADGGVFALGTAPFLGSRGGQPINAPMTAIVRSKTGLGYLLVGEDGGTFAYGDFPFPGSLAGMALNAPVTDAALYTVETGETGVWLVARDGGVFALKAPFYGAATDQANPPPPSYPGTIQGGSGGMVRVTCSNGATTTVSASIAENVRRLYVDARNAGHTGACGGGYRTAEEQIALRRAHCGTSEYDVYYRPANECRPPTARPGESMHEKGLAIDFTVNGQTISRTSPLFAWLGQNASRYGLYNLPSEAWHWSTNGR